jgi:galactitol-specific phosphotransferase system IIB component
VLYQRVKPTYGADGAATDVSVGAPLPVRPVCGTGTGSSVTASTTVGTLLASNANRIGATIFNDSTSKLYLALHSGAAITATAPAAAHTIQIPAGGYYEVPFGYTGIITGLWAAANGAARVTELT